MIQRLRELLEGRGGSYVLPFFWQHGEDEAVLREYMQAIYDSNIREVCVECRPHPDFCGPKWWRDMDVIMDEARKRGMRVWLLDDSHFPTGYANGGYEDADPSLLKKYLHFVTADVDGPTPQVTYDIQREMDRLRGPQRGPGPQLSPEKARELGIHLPKERFFDDDCLQAVIAYRIARGGALGEALDITDHVRDGVLTWDVPEGLWRIYAAYTTHNGGGQSDYMSVISAPSVRVLIDRVYEPHFARYGADFGKTFAGFFSDEPMIGNCRINYDPNSLIGTVPMYLPWNDEVAELLQGSLGEDYLTKTPLLWNASQDADETAAVRTLYMDAVTQLIRQHFSLQIGDWCAAHGVEYIGHLVEDMNSSAKLGLSLGNYYRAQAGQHMAGIDVIGGGVMLAGEDRLPDGAYYGDGEFYHFYLGKLGSGLAHVDPRKRGRAMCELYGAYGWDFGVRSMKYLTDHMLLRGINRFVPHAFSPKAFPDPDCPPHFYAHGLNPQFPYFGRLMAYAQRVAHLIDGGTHVAEVGLLHSDEAQWASPCMLPQKVARELAENQVEFDVIPADIFAEKRYTLDDTLRINGLELRALVVPRYPYIAPGVAAFIEEAAAKGFPVIFVDAAPEGVAAEPGRMVPPAQVLPLHKLADALRAMDMPHMEILPDDPHVRVYHYRQEKDIYLLSNEATGSVWEGEVFLPAFGPACIYDAMGNALRKFDHRETQMGTAAHMKLYPFEPVIVVFGEDCAEEDRLERLVTTGEGTALTGWRVSLREAGADADLTEPFQMETPANLGGRFPDFGGVIRYEKELEIDDPGAGYALSLANAYECVTLLCNGELVDMRLAPNYRFDLTGRLKKGTNALRLEVATTLDRKVCTILGEGGFRRCPPVLDPIGIVGEVKLYKQ